MFFKLDMDRQGFKVYKVYINVDLDLFYGKFKFGQNCSLCYRPIVR